MKEYPLQYQTTGIMLFSGFSVIFPANSNHYDILSSVHVSACTFLPFDHAYLGEGDDLQLLEACNHTEVQLDRVQGSDNDVTVPSKRVRLSAKDDVSSLLSPKI
jgi:hypothetical protein